MQCPRCNWQNPASNTLCFSCNAPLAASASAAAAPAAKAAKSAPARPGNAPVFPGIWPRLGATAIDAVVMVAAMVGFSTAANLTYVALTGNPHSGLLTMAAGFIGLMLPALMDAWGGGSPGKRLLKLRVVNRNGDNPGILRASWRHLMKYALNLALPGIFYRIQRAMFGERAMHNWISSTYVVSSLADPRAVRPAIAKTRSVTGAGKFIFIVLGVLALVAGGMIIGAIVMNPKQEDNPLRAEVIRLDLVSQPVRMLAENHYRRTGAYAPDMAALGVTLESLKSSGFSALSLNPVNGVLRFTIAGEPGTADAPALGGKHLVYLPELRSEKKGGGVRRWQCGSDDIPRADRPYSCRHEAGASAP
ncbi:hypothetical protein LMG26857_02344 [Achromobacter anxifer]|uniref:RDD family protein n=1 Tax=Achromobacter anxifer TaxID=1287737 RepID=UPI00155C22A5|nr:RDD family protein [Achromobacter anxifer]CAB5513070.1 hypothetical protein LMG26857_02344 [Achromobacter anxifer]